MVDREQEDVLAAFAVDQVRAGRAGSADRSNGAAPPRGRAVRQALAGRRPGRVHHRQRDVAGAASTFCQSVPCRLLVKTVRRATCRSLTSRSALVQGRGVEPAGQAHGERQVVQQGGGVHLVQEPQPLLGVGGARGVPGGPARGGHVRRGGPVPPAPAAAGAAGGAVLEGEREARPAVGASNSRRSGTGPTEPALQARDDLGREQE